MYFVMRKIQNKSTGRILSSIRYITRKKCRKDYSTMWMKNTLHESC